MKILCTADLHMGRRSSRIPTDLDSDHFSATGTWNTIVEYALRSSVDVLVLAGDIIDHQNHYYEAFGPLEFGFRRLAAQRIHTIAVSGNHDYDLLKRLENYVGSEFFHLIGQDGKWESYVHHIGENKSIEVLGWSFPTEHVRTNPLQKLDRVISSNIPVIGLLHADIDQVQSNYAPVLKSDLRRFPVSLWIVGHIHVPKITHEDGQPSILIPGSPHALDPGETGTHGVWIVEWQHDITPNVKQIPISPIRYENIDIDLNGVDELSDWESKCTEALKNFVLQNQLELSNIELVLFRIRLLGRTALHAKLYEYCIKMQDLTLTVGDIHLRIEQFNNRTRPAFDLSELSKNNDPPGILSRMLMDLESEEQTKYVNLINDAFERINRVFRNNAYFDIALDKEKPTLQQSREVLLREGYLLLDQLLSQQESVE